VSLQIPFPPRYRHRKAVLTPPRCPPHDPPAHTLFTLHSTFLPQTFSCLFALCGPPARGSSISFCLCSLFSELGTSELWFEILQTSVSPLDPLLSGPSSPPLPRYRFTSWRWRASFWRASSPPPPPPPHKTPLPHHQTHPPSKPSFWIFSFLRQNFGRHDHFSTSGSWSFFWWFCLSCRGRLLTRACLRSSPFFSFFRRARERILSVPPLLSGDVPPGHTTAFAIGLRFLNRRTSFRVPSGRFLILDFLTIPPLPAVLTARMLGSIFFSSFFLEVQSILLSPQTLKLKVRKVCVYLFSRCPRLRGSIITPLSFYNQVCSLFFSVTFHGRAYMVYGFCLVFLFLLGRSRFFFPFDRASTPSARSFL